MQTLSVVLIALVASAVAVPDARVPSFVEGFAMGLTTELKNVSECAARVGITLVPFEKALPVVAQALEKDSVSSLKYTLPLLGVGIQEVAKALKICKSPLHALVDDIGQSFQSSDKSAEVLSKTLLPQNQENLQAMASAFAAQDYFTAGVYGGRSVSSFFSTETDQVSSFVPRRTY